MIRGTCLVAVLAVAGHAAAWPVIGGFDINRGGAGAIASSVSMVSLRGAITSAIPTATFVESNTLTPEFLLGVDVLVLMSPSGATSAIAPLTSDEQNAMRQFVLNGKEAILLVDNDTYGGGFGIVANQSLISPFGCHVMGTGQGWAVDIPTTPTPPITSGLAGDVPLFHVGWTGWFDQLGPGVVSVATDPATGLPVLAYLPRGALGACSGPVVLFGDSTLMFAGYMGPPESTLVLNAIFYGGLPCECYANCDNSTIQPILNVNDFVCFQARFASGNTYANCDHSTQPPVLNVNDFICFQSAFAAGCH